MGLTASPRFLSIVAALLSAAGCTSATAGADADCTGFTDWAASPYRLPYPSGTAWPVNQANCSGEGHSGFWRYGYDFSMPVGAVVTAAREGVVGWSRGDCVDGDGTCTNLVTIIHPDGVVTVYSHLTSGGALVVSGATVAAGDTIGRSGNTGFTSGFPHLHFSLHPCNQLPGLPGAGDCPTLPLTFANTDPNPSGLEAGRSYRAR
jgi:murein DD-endopeptidase MepM/ murein hydrolase activator NlpD